MTESLPVHLFGAAIGRIERAGSTSLVVCADLAGLLPAVRKLSLSQGDRHRLLS